MAIGTSTHVLEQALAGISGRESLFAFLRDELRWPLNPEDTFTYPGLEVSGDKVGNAQVSQIVPFGAGDPFLIMLAEFEGRFTRSALREVLRDIRRDMRTRSRYEGKSLEDIIFVCASEGYSAIRFARFEYREGKQPKLSSFAWETDLVEETRTLREVNLPALRMRVNVLGQPDWQQKRPNWLAAWNVERVTDEFFKTYRRVFEQVEGMIEGVKGEKRLFTQRLFNRLLFIQFLQKKRWLRFEGSTNYLPAIFASAKAKGENFYRERLHWLFFHGLGRAMDIPSDGNDRDVLDPRIGEVPFLNGGLFEMEHDDEKLDAVWIPDAAFDVIFRELLDRYNFTITESTPLDVEVAVDPEMLGRIFEELVTGRHETGGYYTPKPIVSFMCREALKGYLASAVPDESPEAIAAFVDQHDAGQIADGEGVLRALVNVRACDPACGSGAYLLGMLHELIDLRSCLFATKKIDAETLYDKKLDIIQNCLFGVDIDQFAVNTARLRLWLSLVVDDTRNPLDDPTLDVSLPNLDFKIEKGDSLTAPDPTGGKQLDMFRRQQIEEFRSLKSGYMRAHGQSKWALRKQVDKQRKAVTKGAHEGAEVVGFDWEVEFAEVFLPEGNGAARPGGFDIVVANPPYVRQELIKDIKPLLKAVYGDLFSSTADLYVFFYLRALQILRPGGMLAFISSNKWFKVDYGANLRKKIAHCCHVVSITDFGDLPVFKATAYPMIFIAQKGKVGQPPTFTAVPTLDEPYPDVMAVVRKYGLVLPKEVIRSTSWVLTDAASADRRRKMEKAGMPLGE